MAIIGDYIFYVQEKIECSLLTSKNYISTENMLNNAKGVYESSVTPTEGKCCKYVEGDILLSNIRPYFRKVWFADKVGGCSNDVLCFRKNKNLILNKYVFYILSSQRFIDYVVSTSKGTKMPRGDKSSILKYGVKIPSLSIQQEIIDIIEPIEKLSQCLYNMKEKLEISINKLPINKTGDAVNWSTISTGKRNADHETRNGKYNFYTCGSEIKRCSEPSFKGRNIILSGSANLYSWWYDGEFDLYQRVYALDTNSDFFTSLYSLKSSMSKLRDESAGSVIKYITLNDIKGIIMYDNKYEDTLKQLYKSINLISNLVYKLEKQKSILIKLLVK